MLKGSSYTRTREMWKRCRCKIACLHRLSLLACCDNSRHAFSCILAEERDVRLVSKQRQAGAKSAKEIPCTCLGEEVYAYDSDADVAASREKGRLVKVKLLRARVVVVDKYDRGRWSSCYVRKDTVFVWQRTNKRVGCMCGRARGLSAGARKGAASLGKSVSLLISGCRKVMQARPMCDQCRTSGSSL